MCKAARLVRRTLLVLLAFNASSAATLAADACAPHLRKKLPKCASWQHEPNMGIEFKNNCDYTFAYLIELGTGSDQLLEGEVAAGEIVLEAMDFGQYKVRNVYCCARGGKC